MKGNREWAASLADKLDLPGELLPGTGCVTLSGDRRALIEGQKGILAYSPECVVLRLGRQKLSLLGRDLTIRALCGDRMLICGKIQRAELEE